MAQRKIWGMEMAVVVLGLLAMVQQSMQLSLKNPLPLLPRNIRSDVVPAFGLVTTSYSAEKALYESGFFSPISQVDLLGRRFLIGEIYGSPVVLVRTSGNPSVHVGITVQIMAENFNLRGIIHFGGAGATNKSLSIGSVTVPFLVGFTGSWTWLSKDSNEQGPLVFGDFNTPVNGQNSLGSVKYNDVEIYYKGKLYDGGNFWLYPSPRWQLIASRVQIDSGDVVVGLNASSADIYVNNPAYGKFLYDTFKISTVDTSSAAVILGAKTHALKFVSFQGVTNYAGVTDSTPSSIELANKNVAKAVINFIWQATVPRHANEPVDL